MPIVFSHIDEHDGRYSDGNQSTFLLPYVIHIPSELTPAPKYCGGSGFVMSMILQTSGVLIAIDPISEWRQEPVKSNDKL
jgi:hypothetical protein